MIPVKTVSLSRRDFCQRAGLSMVGLASVPGAFLQAPPAPVFNVRTFGAVGDGKTLDTKAIQGAIDAAHQAGGGMVLLPAGTYLSGSLVLKSKVDLRLEACATLLGSTARTDYQCGYWYALLLAAGQEDIAISGRGTIDGQGRDLAADVLRRVKQGEIIDPLGNNRPSEKQRPQLVEFRRCRGVHVSGITFRDSACWVQSYIDCQDLLIERVRVDSTAYWNNDGMDITDCKSVRVSDCDINSADDGICLKSSSPETACQDVEISACRVRSSASAFKCGTASHGGFQNIHVHDLLVYDTYRSAIALECVDGGSLSNVRVENVHARNTGNAVFIRLGSRDQTAPVGQIADVLVRNVKVEVPAGAPDIGYETAGPPVELPHNLIPSSITGLPQHPVRDVGLRDVEIVYAGGGTPDRARIPLAELGQLPEQAQSYPEFSMFGELPAWALYVRHAQGMELQDFHVSLKQADFRPAMVFDDVANLYLDRVDSGPLSGAPVIVLKDAPQADLRTITYPKGSGENLRLMGKSSLLNKPRAISLGELK